MCGGWVGDVIDDVKEVVDDTKDTVVDWGKEVVDTGSDVSDWVVDEIFDPIVETTEDIYKTIEDDPLYNIAKITAIATGNSWALPLIDGAKVANNGGEWEDIARAAAKSYVASKVGASAGQYAGDAAGQYITNEAASAAAQEVVSQAVGQAASTAVMTGGDLKAIKDSLVQGAITGGVGAGLDYIEASIPTYENLPQSAKNVVSTYIGAVANNQDATPEMLTNAAISGMITADIVQKYVDSDESMTDRQIAAVTSGLQNTLSAAINGKPLSDAAINAISQYGAASMEEWLDTSGKDLINKGYDRITGSYGDVNDSITKIDEETNAYNTLIDNYNEKVSELTPRYDERDRLYEEYQDALAANQAQPSQATRDAALAAGNRYKSYADSLQSDYDKSYKSYLEDTMAKINASRTKLDEYTATYETQLEDLKSDTYKAELELAPVYEGLNKIVVEGLTGGAGNFNPEEYKQINGLGEDDDAYQHYLDQGRANDAPVNAQEHVTEIQRSKDLLIQQTMGNVGISVSQLSEDQQKAISGYYADMSLDQLRNADVAAVTADIEKVLVDSYRNMGENGDASIDAALEAGFTNREIIDQAQKLVPPAKTARAEGITDSDIISGRATYQQGDDGLWKWDDIRVSVPTPRYNEELGIYTLYQESIENGVLTVKETNPLNNQVFSDFSAPMIKTVDGYDYYSIPNGSLYRGKILNPQGEITEDITRIDIAMQTRSTLDRLAQEDRAAFIANVGSIAGDAYEELVDAFGAPIVDFAQDLTNRVLEIEGVQDVLESETFRNVAGITTEGGGELLNAFNTLSILVGIDPKSTPLAGIADDLIALGGDLKTESYKKGQANIQSRIQYAGYELETDKDGNLVLDEDGRVKPALDTDGNPIKLDPNASAWERAFNTVTAIGGAALTNPGVFAGEYIFKELVQEVPIFIASGGVGNVTRRMLQEAGEKFAADIGKKASLSTALVLDTAESFGGTAAGAYDEALQVALQSGMSEEEAQAYAVDKAITAGGIAAVTSLATGGAGAGRVNDAVFNGKKGKTFDRAFATIGGETLSEGAEEGFAQTYLETQFVQLDPTRDSVGNVTANAVLGMIGGFGTSSTIYGTTFSNDAVTNAVQIFNPQVRNVIYNAPNTQEGAAQAQQQLADLGLNDNVLQTNLLNNVFDAGFTTTDEAYNAYQATNSGYTPTQEDVNRFVGAGDTTQQINEYVADRTTTDADEARQYFTDLGYQATEDQINQFVGDTFEDTTRTNIGEYVAPRQTTADYVREQLSRYGYTPTDEEVNRFVGFGTEATFKQDKTAEITDYLDPFVNTEQEVRQIYSDLGLDNVRQEDVDRFTGTVDVGQDLQSDIENYQNTATANVLTDQVQNLTTQLETVMQQQQDTQQEQNTQTQNLVTNLAQNLLQRDKAAADEAERQRMMQSGVFGGQMGEVTTPDPAQIDYVYDFSSIFANPQQESMFPSPYKRGGSVSTTDKLLGIINNE